MSPFPTNPNAPVAAEVRAEWDIPRFGVTAALVWLAVNPAHAEPSVLEQARAAVASQHFVAAESLLRNWLNTHDKDHEARFLLAQVLAGQEGKTSDALAEFDRLLSDYPTNTDLLLGKAEVLQRLGKAADALPLLKKARRLAPNQEQIWRAQINALLEAGGESRMRQVRLIQAAAAQRFPDSNWDNVRRASPSAPIATANRRRPQAAETGDTGYLLRRSRELVNQGKSAEALPLLKKARRAEPRREEIWRLQITALLDAGTESGYRQAALIQQGAVRWFPGSRWDTFPAKQAEAAPVQEDRPMQGEWPPRGQFIKARFVPGEPTFPMRGDAIRLIPSIELSSVPQSDEADPVQGIQNAAPPEYLALATNLNKAAPQSRAVPSEALKEPVPPVEAPVKRTELEIGFSYDTLNNDYDSWRSVYLYGQRDFGDGKGIYGSSSRTERFAEVDRELLGGVYTPIGGRWSALAEASASDTHRILAKSSVLGQLSYQSESGWGGNVGLRHTRYNDYNLNVKSAMVERYWGNYRAAYTYTLSKLAQGGESATSNEVRGDYYYGERNSIGLSYLRGQEVFVYQDGTPSGYDTKSLTLNGTHWVTRDWAITHQLVYHQQDYYTRKGISIGFRYSF